MSVALRQLRELLTDRRSCRGFLPDPVPQALIGEILETAQQTSSWCNSQPWQVIVTRGDATDSFRVALHAHAASAADASQDYPFPREYRGIYAERRRDAGLRLYDAVGIAHDDAASRRRQSLENFRLFGAPHVAIVTSDEALGVYGAVDCGGYVANFLLAAAAAGIGTVPQAAIAHHSAFVRRHFALGGDRRIVCGISFGFADPSHPANQVATGRASLAQAIDFRDG